MCTRAHADLTEDRHWTHLHLEHSLRNFDCLRS
jgi:hypothetical protein